MIKHVGVHNKKKAVIVFREVPGESDQALIVYPEKLPSLLHDEMMSSLESPSGQQSNDVNEVFFRTLMADGMSILTSLHAGGYLIKVPTSSVTVTPTTNRQEDLQLNKLNEIVRQISSGEPMGRDLGEPELVESSNAGVLSDHDLAESQRKQAAQMKAEAKRLLDEALLLEKEAMALSPKNDNKKTTIKKQKAAS